MNYRHAFHAGNFTDVFKHIVLIALIQSLLKKETAFCYLETHAGAGMYDLFSSAAQKNKEYENGIAKLFLEKNAPPLINDYLSCIRKLNKSQLRSYPGSPYLAKQWLRPQDRMVLCELHEEEYRNLKTLFGHDQQIAIHHQDGYQGLKAFLPPKERRGLILIDPPYEKPDEFSLLISQLVKTIERFATGIYAIWYPLKIRSQIATFYRDVQTKIIHPTLTCEFSIYPTDVELQLHGCGMFIINPPWQCDQRLKEVVPWLLEKLNIAHGSYRMST